MKNTGLKEQGILVIAAVFGFIGGAMVYVTYGLSLPGSGLVALIVALGVAVVLWLGWRAPTASPMAADPVPVATTSGGQGLGGTTSGAAGPAIVSDHAAASAATTAPMGATVAADGADEAGSPVVATSAAADSGVGVVLKPTTRLAGQDELASRKGVWKYDGKADAGVAAATSAASVAQAMPDAATQQAAVSTQTAGAMNGESVAAIAAREDMPDLDDGAPTPDVGDKPTILSGPRDGGADNLKEIKGVGPKLEGTLHDMGIYHFDQIAGWSATEIAWMDNNLKGFRGRVSRDGWIDQAKILAAGGETAFSKRVDKGGVY